MKPKNLSQAKARKLAIRSKSSQLTSRQRRLFTARAFAKTKSADGRYPI